MRIANLPNVLTIARIMAVPLVVILFYWSHPWSNPLAASVFIAAAITDSLDGYLARRLGITTPLGEFMDPVADKLMVATALVLNAFQSNMVFYITPTQVADNQAPRDRAFRMGGLVEVAF